jgi:hypothetical protein
VFICHSLGHLGRFGPLVDFLARHCAVRLQSCIPHAELVEIEQVLPSRQQASSAEVVAIGRDGLAAQAFDQVRPVDSAMTVVFELEGQRFIGLNGGPHFRFSEAVSFSIDCRTQADVD